MSVPLRIGLNRDCPRDIDRITLFALLFSFIIGFKSFQSLFQCFDCGLRRKGVIVIIAGAAHINPRGLILRTGL